MTSILDLCAPLHAALANEAESASGSTLQLTHGAPSMLSDSVEVLPLAGRTMFVKKTEHSVLMSDDFTPEELRAIAAHIESQVSIDQ